MHFITWFFSAEAVAIVTCNVVTIVIFTSTRRLRCRKYSLIVNLAVADLFVGLVSVPMYIITTRMVTSENFLTAYRLQDIFFGAATLFGLAAVAIERFYATYHPFKHHTLSTVRYVIGVCMVWAMPPTILMCQYLADNLNDRDTANIIQVTFPIIAISSPIFIVLISYCLIWIKVSFRRNIPNHAIQKRNKKLTVTLAVVTLVSLIAWIPWLCVMVYLILCFNFINCPNLTNVFNPNVEAVFKWASYGNSFVNFIVYIVRMRAFRMEILRRMRSLRCRQNAVNYPNDGIQAQSTRNRRDIDETFDTHL